MGFHVHVFNFKYHGIIDNAWPTTVKECRCGTAREKAWPATGKADLGREISFSFGRQPRRPRIVDVHGELEK